DAFGPFVREQVDVAPGGIAESRGDRRHGGRELGGVESRAARRRTQGRTIHAGILPMAVGEIREPVNCRVLGLEGWMTVTEAQVLDVLRPVEDPELRRSIVDLGMVRRIDIAGGDVNVLVA